MRIDNDETFATPINNEVGLSSAMHDMRTLAASYREHAAEEEAPHLALPSTIDNRVLLLPKTSGVPEHWKLTALMLMVLLGLSTSALAALTFGSEPAEQRRIYVPELAAEEKPESLSLPAFTPSSEPPLYEVSVSPPSSMATPETREPVVPEVKTSKVRSRKPRKIRSASACDEVACLLGDGQCCGESEEAAIKADAQERVRPDRLTRKQVMTPMQSIAGRVRSCSDRHDYKGVALVTLKIAENGQVQGFDLDDGSAAFQGCVEKQVTSLQFAELAQPFTVSYPFTF